MNIKNYTSTIDASRSMARIEELLVNIGATNISKQYIDKACAGITFLIFDEQLKQTIVFHLQAQAEECYKVLYDSRSRHTAATLTALRQQSIRTAWKILSNWTEIQCSMILLGQAKPLQMFLPFVYDTKTETTFFDNIASGSMKLLSR
jgi:hypothetical protein